MINNKKVAKRGIGPTKDRNKIAGPWVPLAQYGVPEEAQKASIIALFQNNRYVVYVKSFTSSELKTPDGKDSRGVHLIVARHDKKKSRDWDDLQRIKNEVCGPTCEAVELFPSEMRRLDIPKHQTHLWVYDPTITLPHGLVPKEMHAAHHARRMANAIPPEDRNVYVVFKRDAEGARCPAEVYSDIEEARVIYGDALDAKETEEFAAKACGLDAIPPPDFQPTDGVGSVWTEASKKKHEDFIEIMIRAMALPEQVDQMLDFNMARLDDGPMDEVEYEASGDAERDLAAKTETQKEQEAAVSLAEERERLRAEREAAGK